MVRCDLFASRDFSVANIYTFFLYAAIGGSLYFVPFVLINVHHYSPTAAGAALLPFIFIMVVSSRWSGGLVAQDRRRARRSCSERSLPALGFLAYALPGTGGSYWTTFFPAAAISRIRRRALRRAADDDGDELRQRRTLRRRFGRKQRGRAHRRPHRRRGARHRRHDGAVVSLRISRRDDRFGAARVRLRRRGLQRIRTAAVIVAQISDMHVKRRGAALQHMAPVARPLRRTFAAIDELQDPQRQAADRTAADSGIRMTRNCSAG